MSKYLIADFLTEYTAKYDNLKELSKPFEYQGKRSTDIKLNISDEHLRNLLGRMVDGTTKGAAENFAYSSAFNKAIIKSGAMLVHSSAIMYRGKAYLFSAQSGIGKSTHTRLWKQAFSDEVTFINDDKPVLRLNDSGCIVYGTPFDGGSSIANNISAPLGGIIFLERGEENSIQKLDSTSEILKRLYFSTVHFVSKATAESMLSNFEKLVSCADFYLLICNMDISAAYVARDFLINNSEQ